MIKYIPKKMQVTIVQALSCRLPWSKSKPASRGLRLSANFLLKEKTKISHQRTIHKRLFVFKNLCCILKAVLCYGIFLNYLLFFRTCWTERCQGKLWTGIALSRPTTIALNGSYMTSNQTLRRSRISPTTQLLRWEHNPLKPKLLFWKYEGVQ